MTSSHTGPEWLYLPLPANADADAKLLATVEQLCSRLPDDFAKLQMALDDVRALASYDPAVNRANELVWERFEKLVASPEGAARIALVKYAVEHLPVRGLARVLRRLAKDPDTAVRNHVTKAIRKAKI